MEIKYRVFYFGDVIKYDIPNLSKPVQKKIKSAIEEKLIANPVFYGKPLQYNLKGYRSFRVGDYRVIFKIDNDMIIINAIKHRKSVYN